MNRIEIIGRISKDIEFNTLNSGVSVAKFSIATDRKFKDASGNKITDFFNVVAWRGIAEIISKYCKKGSKIFIAGELQNRTYDKEDGTKAYITEIIVNDFEFLDSKETKTTEDKDLEPVDNTDLPF